MGTDGLFKKRREQRKQKLFIKMFGSYLIRMILMILTKQ